MLAFLTQLLANTWIAIAILLVIPTLAIGVHARRGKLSGIHCFSCGYSLASIAHRSPLRCPECGRADSSSRPHTRKTRRDDLRLAMLVGIAESAAIAASIASLATVESLPALAGRLAAAVCVLTFLPLAAALFVPFWFGAANLATVSFGVFTVAHYGIARLAWHVSYATPDRLYPYSFVLFGSPVLVIWLIAAIPLSFASWAPFVFLRRPYR